MSRRLRALAVVGAMLLSLLQLAPRTAYAGMLTSGTMWIMDTGGTIHQYDLSTNSQGPTYSVITELGRGLAYDPADGQLWFSALKADVAGDPATYHGDGFIHKVNLATGAQTTIPDPTTAQSSTIQGQGIGALSMDPDNGSLWAASLWPDANNQFRFYNLNDSTGAVVSQCGTPKVLQVNNHNLKVTRPGDLTQKAILTELALSGPTIYALDPTTCSQLKTYTLPVTVGFTGMDVDNLTGNLIGTNEFSAYNVGVAPYSTNPGGNFIISGPGEGLTLKQDNKPAITGTASCTTSTGDITLLSSVATAQVMSGSVVVATIPVVNGAWTLTGAAPNSTYSVQYFTSTGVPVCGATVTTDANGNGTSSAAFVPPDKGNHHWTNCSPSSPVGTYQSSCNLDGVAGPVTDYLLASNLSDWYSVSVGPGEQVTVSLQTPSVPVAAYLYRDLQHEVDTMTAAKTAGTVDAHALSASLGAAQSAPFDQGPFDQGPFDQGPFDQGPFDQGPFDQGPFDQGPFDQGPFDQGAIDPAPFDQGPFDQGAYTSAQQRALIAYSAKKGASPLLLIRNTWDKSGRWYFRFVGLNGVYDNTHPITFSTTLTDNGCGTLNTTPVAPSTTTVTAARTLILTDTAQVTAAGGDAVALMTRLNKFKADHADLNVQVVDVSQDANITQNYAYWLAHQSCAPAANIAANSIHQLIDLYRKAGLLEYVVLAGGDHVIPFWRVPDESVLGQENHFSPPVTDASTSQATLRQDYYLSQDFYGSFQPVSRPSHDLYLPSTVSVGRLVETVPEITKMLDTYDASGGILRTYDANGTNHRALVTGYSGLARLAANQKATLAGGGLSVDSLIEDPTKGPSDQSAWTADQLRTLLTANPGTGAAAARHDIVALEGHFSANGALSADYKTAIYSSELVGLTNPSLQNSLVLSNGCHSLYNVTNSDAVNSSVALDWAEVFAGNGMTSIGGTGYQYFDSDLVLLSSAVLDNLTSQLTYDPSPGAHTPVPIGKALNAAKLNYADSLVGMEGTAEKSLGELSLYGLPFWSVDVQNRQAATGLVSWFNTDTSSGGVNVTALRAGFAKYDATPSFTLNETDLTRPVLGSTTPNIDSYFNAGQSSDVWASPYRPILPQKAMNVHAAGDTTGLVARGAVVLSADYRDVSTNTSGTPFRPYVEVPSTEFGSLHPHFETSVFSPLQPAYLNDLVGESLHVLPMQYRSARDANGNLTETGTARLLSSPKVRVYYSSSTDPNVAFAGPPSISQVRVTPSATAGSVHVDVIVSGPLAVDLEDLLVSYAYPLNGATHLASCSLIGTGLDSGTVGACGTPARIDQLPSTSNSYIREYSGEVASPTGNAADVQLYIQAISGAGLATQDTNGGSYYTSDTTSLASPKAVTKLVLQPLPSPVAYHSLVPVKALLTAAGAPLAGKLVTFTLGGTRVVGTTDDTGTATPPNGLPANVEPGTYVVQASFSEDLKDLAAGDSGAITVSAATASFSGVASPANLVYSQQAVLGTLVSGGTELDARSVVIDIGGGRAIGALTTELGQVILDTRTFDGQPIAPGSYTVTLSYNNPVGKPYDDRFSSATASVAVSVGSEAASIHFVDPGTQPANSVILAAVVSQPADSSLADLSRASITYTLTPDNGTPAVTVNNVPVNKDGTSSTTLTTLSSAVYTVSARIDTTGGVQWLSGGLDATSDTLLAVFPAGSSVTGSGKVTPAVPPDLGVSGNGQAHFAFFAAYKSGATVPTGSLEFQINGGSATDPSAFTETGYDWMVITGTTRVEIQGTGTLKQASATKTNQKFWVLGQINADGSQTFEIHIWDPTASGNSVSSPAILVKGTLNPGSKGYTITP